MCISVVRLLIQKKERKKKRRKFRTVVHLQRPQELGWSREGQAIGNVVFLKLADQNKGLHLSLFYCIQALQLFTTHSIFNFKREKSASRCQNPKSESLRHSACSLLCFFLVPNTEMISWAYTSKWQLGRTWRT